MNNPKVAVEEKDFSGQHADDICLTLTLPRPTHQPLCFFFFFFFFSKCNHEYCVELLQPRSGVLERRSLTQLSLPRNVIILFVRSIRPRSHASGPGLCSSPRRRFSLYFLRIIHSQLSSVPHLAILDQPTSAKLPTPLSPKSGPLIVGWGVRFRLI